MNGTAKITSLVAVLGLCLAALAGSAYAYTATYSDTIGHQPVESVYVTINDDSSGVITNYAADADVDVVYDTLTVKNGGTTYRLTDNGTESADNYVVESEIEFARVVVDRDAQTVTLDGIIDAVALKAYGDDATGSLAVTLNGEGWSTTGGKFQFSSNGITATISVVGPDAVEVATATSNTITVSGINLAVGEVAKVCQLKITIVVDQLVVPEEEHRDYFEVDSDAKSSDGLLNDKVTLPGFSVTYVFAATQQD